MSKSLGNYIGITEPPGETFGKIMSISDELMWQYFELLSFRRLTDIGDLKKAVREGLNPRDAKFELAEEIVARFHSQTEAARAKEQFVARFSQGEVPESIPEVSVATIDGRIGVAHVLKASGLVSSTSEAFRMIGQGAVRIDGQRVEDRGREVAAGTSHVYQVGKRKFVRVHLT
jgi:tyrosyl-tRNA synthetase